MNTRNLIVLKIGGSVITDKNGELAPKTDVISRIVEEIFNSEAENLILIHGGGSFGHPPAKQYAIKEGLKENGQKIGFAETHHFMTVLNGLFMDALIWHHVPALSVTPSSCILTENSRIKRFDDQILTMLIGMNVLPVLYGDAILDTKLGFTILSGDQLTAHLAMRFDARRVLVGVDVDGLYDADPKSEKNAKLLDHLTLKELKQLKGRMHEPVSGDVTGGMLGKVNELLPAAEKGIPIEFFNASKTNNVFKVLRGERVADTLVEKE